jgi:hypothetical protein
MDKNDSRSIRQNIDKKKINPGKMIYLVSYPRSGNTFFRIVLHEVYGIKSVAYKGPFMEKGDYSPEEYPVIKTHLLPGEVPEIDRIPAVYLVRDGRDAIVSMAHHKKDIIDPGSDYVDNLKEIILAKEGSHFGGWSRHVLSWYDRAAVVVRFEDLIRDPIECVEKIRPFIEMSEPDPGRLPDFETIKTKDIAFFSGKDNSGPQWRQKFFRRGKVGGWMDEMPPELEELFWELHGEGMKRAGYSRSRWRYLLYRFGGSLKRNISERYNTLT